MGALNGRNAVTGRFEPGNQCARGDAHRRIRHFRKVLLDALTDDDIKKALAKTIELVEEGNATAIRMILEYGCGSPAQMLELSGPDGEPLGVTANQFADAIVEALGGHPDARRAAALAIRRLASANRPGDDRDGSGLVDVEN